jgi:hypothetical protein
MFDNGLINPIYQTFSSRIGVEEDHALIYSFASQPRLWASSKVLRNLTFPLFQVRHHFYFYNSVLEIGKDL